jgi:hypothetical protein
VSKHLHVHQFVLPSLLFEVVAVGNPEIALQLLEVVAARRRRRRRFPVSSRRALSKHHREQRAFA